MNAKKAQLIRFMHCSGFDWITDIDYVDGHEIVASKRDDGADWWRDLEVEGSGFTQIFKGSIKDVFRGNNE